MNSNLFHWPVFLALTASLSIGLVHSTRAATSTVDWDNVHQRIDGFGASSAWNSTWTTAEADLLFSTNNNISYSGGTYNGIGLSLLRNHITYANTTSSNATPTTVETSIMQMAQARGAKVWSAPWTPAAGFKSPNDIWDSGVATGGGINGGTYLGGDATNKAYASQLANYVYSMEHSYGINIYAISIQNEPDANVTSYEACQWNSVNIHDFVTNLYNALVAKGVGSTKIMLPESQSWTDPHHFSYVMNDPHVAPDVGIIADHNYVATNSVGDQTTPAAMNSYGKALWETEVALLSGSDSSITNGVYYAKRIYLFMTQAQANAYHYWWLRASGNSGLIATSDFPTKRLFTFGQYSRFVRPNFYRIDATSSESSVLISAYRATNSTSFAIVVVNTSPTSDVMQTFNLTNFTATSVTPWITSASLSLAPQTPVNVTSSSFTYDVPAMSVVTFVGQGIVIVSNTPPTLAPVADQSINAGQTLLVTNAATDPNVPPDTLTFGLLNTNLSGATLTGLNATNALLTWRAPVSYAGTTNLVAVAVTNTTSLLSDTNSFKVIVNPLSSQPAVGSITTTNGLVTLVLNGPQGPDYTVLTSTNLTDPLSSWQVLMTTNSPVTPVTVTVPLTLTNLMRCYSIKIGP